VSYEDVDRVFFPALDHRLVLNFEAEADRVTSRDILREVRESVRKTAAVPAACAT